MQAVYGNVVVTEDAATDPADRRYALPPEAAEVLTDEHSLSYLGALPRMFAAVGRNLEDLLAAYRSGGGVSWAQLGADARESQAATNRPWFDARARPGPGRRAGGARGAVRARLPDRRRRVWRGLVQPSRWPGPIRRRR